MIRPLPTTNKMYVQYQLSNILKAEEENYNWIKMQNALFTKVKPYGCVNNCFTAIFRNPRKMLRTFYRMFFYFILGAVIIKICF